MKKLTIYIETEIAAPPEKVWEVFSTTDNMHKWLGLLGYQPQVGAEYIMHVDAPEGKVDFFGEVIVFDPPRELAFSWTQQEEGKPPWPVSTLVTITLDPTPLGTHVTLTHSGFEALPEAIAQEEFDGHVVGWDRSQALAGLKELVEANSQLQSEV